MTDDEITCECPYFMTGVAGMPLGHERDQCPNTYNLQLYRCDDGVERWLCDCCWPGLTLSSIPLSRTASVVGGAQ